jgi:hypothetical protein
VGGVARFGSRTSTSVGRSGKKRLDGSWSARAARVSERLDTLIRAAKLWNG